ncbi:hypothetical protein NX059_007870 [Plenodomus lindquistii]|nr:hypothetical protein NX059_007870 [Plenodomus lindquistii]
MASEGVDDAEPSPRASRDTRRDNLAIVGSHAELLQAGHNASSLDPRNVQLPFRTVSDRPPDFRHVELNQQDSAVFADLSEHTTIRSMSSDNTSHVREGGPHVRPHTPTGNHTDLRGGAGSESKGKEAADRTPSSIRRAQKLESPLPSKRSRGPVKASATPAEIHPIRHLKGYFKSPLVEPLGVSYHFRESFLYPQSEPRPRMPRQALLSRSLSSISLPPLTSLTPKLDSPDLPDEAVFGSKRSLKASTEFKNAQGLNDPSTSRVGSSHSLEAVSRSRNTQRHSSSAASGASAAFSYYGSLPSGSRQSSSGMSGTDQLTQFQYDGATASREIHSNVHHRVRSLGQASGSLRSSPMTGSSWRSPDARTRYSPLPSSPYTRVQEAHAVSQASSASGTTSGPSNDFPDAIQAAARDLRSPLENYSEQYQHFLGDQYSRDYLPSNPPQLQPTVSTSNRARRGSSGDNFRIPQAPRPTRGRQIESQTTGRISQQCDRSHHATRADQRSSENVPVTSLVTSHRTAPGQVQRQRVAYELLQNASRAMQSIGPRMVTPVSPEPSLTTSPLDISNRDRVQGPRPMASQPASRRQDGALPSGSPQPLPGFNQRSRAPARGPALSSTSSLPPPPPGYGPTPQYREGPQRSHARTQRQVSTTAAPALHLHPSRDSPLTSLALDHGSGITSRRSRSPFGPPTAIARTHRRIPAHQRDQENSAEPEIEAMRREEAAVNARYGEIGQRETMDETPPRVGRFERAMFE